MQAEPSMPELSDEARAVLRDFILVFDLDDSFKGSTVISNDEAAQVLHYIQSMFECAGIPAPTTNMTDKGLAKHAKALRGANKFKKEHAKFYELIKFVFELCNVNTADGLLAAIALAKGRPVPEYYVPKGVSSRKLNAAKEELDTSESKRAEEKKRSDAKIAELNQKVAELTSTMKEMKAKRDGATKLGMCVISGTSTLPALAESNKILTDRLVELKSTLSESIRGNKVARSRFLEPD